MRELFDALHTIKGLGGMVGVESIMEIAHALETLLAPRIARAARYSAAPSRSRCRRFVRSANASAFAEGRTVTPARRG